MMWIIRYLKTPSPTLRCSVLWSWTTLCSFSSNNNNTIPRSLLTRLRTLMCELSFPTESSIVLSKQKTLENHLTDRLPFSDLFQALSNWAKGYFCHGCDRSWRPSQIPLSNGDRTFQTIVWNGFFCHISDCHQFPFKSFISIMWFFPQDETVLFLQRTMFSQTWAKTPVWPLPGFEASAMWPSLQYHLESR